MVTPTEKGAGCGLWFDPWRWYALRSLLDESITDQRLIETFDSLRVPRHLFKFIYRLLMAHCNAYTDDKPVWQVRSETFEATLASYRRDQQAVDRGLQAG